uniref:Uncharacterized protein n=1 Tax=Arundo donax TaxID=35708 RepID=A0A0A9H7B0_ARUDO
MHIATNVLMPHVESAVSSTIAKRKIKHKNLS